MLDEFAATNLDSKKPEDTSGPSRPAAAATESKEPGDVFSDDEFAKQLQAGMADLLGGIESSVRVAGGREQA